MYNILLLIVQTMALRTQHQTFRIDRPSTPLVRRNLNFEEWDEHDQRHYENGVEWEMMIRRKGTLRDKNGKIWDLKQLFPDCQICKRNGYLCCWCREH